MEGMEEEDKIDKNGEPKTNASYQLDEEITRKIKIKCRPQKKLAVWKKMLCKYI